MKNRTLITINFCIAVAVYSNLMFLLVPNKNSAFFITYFFTLLAISSVFGAAMFLYYANRRHIYQNISFMSLAVIYLTIVMIVNVIYLFIEYNSSIQMQLVTRWYFSIHFVIFSGAIIFAVFLVQGKNYIDKLDENKQKQISNIRKMIAEVDKLRENAKVLAVDEGKIVLKELAQIREAIRYSDPISHESLKFYEDDIKENLIKLEKQLNGLRDYEVEDDKTFIQISTKIQRLIEERNNWVKIMKQNA